MKLISLSEMANLIERMEGDIQDLNYEPVILIYISPAILESENRSAKGAI